MAARKPKTDADGRIALYGKHGTRVLVSEDEAATLSGFTASPPASATEPSPDADA